MQEPHWATSHLFVLVFIKMSLGQFQSHGAQPKTVLENPILQMDDVTVVNVKPWVMGPAFFDSAIPKRHGAAQPHGFLASDDPFDGLQG